MKRLKNISNYTKSICGKEAKPFETVVVPDNTDYHNRFWHLVEYGISETDVKEELKALDEEVVGKSEERTDAMIIYKADKVLLEKKKSK